MSGLASPDEAPGGVGLRSRLLAMVFALVAAALLAALIVLVHRSNELRDRALARKQHSFDVMMLTSDVDGSMARAEAALSRYITDGDSGTGTLYLDEWRRAGQGIDALRGLVSDNRAQAARADALRRLYVLRERELAKPAALASYGRGWQALSLFSKAGRSDVLPRIRKLLRDMAGEERATLDRRSTAAALRADQSNALQALFSGVGVLLVLSAIAAGWLAVSALARQRIARAEAQAEIDRTQMLEAAVADRTQALSEANARLIEEAGERQQAEARLRQVQKMDAVGQLTGGIAHDFNNMLAVVVGGLELARRRVTEQAAEATRHIDSAMEGAGRAAALTRRLLTFSRAEPLLPSAIDPGALIAGMADLIDRTIGERVAVRVEAAAELWPVWVDPFQLENAILNLCVNARDAMDGAGTLRIVAENRMLAAGEIEAAAAGAYVRIAVIDDGQGMSPQVLERVFEPFFTTKPVGKGTGLGLSQIFGFTRQSGGDVAISSIEGEGTTVALFLPRHDGRASVAGDVEPEAAAIVPERDGAAILVVEDDPRVRAATGDALLELGYRPVLATSGAQALALLAERADVALLMTDVVMPDMTGPDLVRRVAPAHPDLPVLFVTGYVGEAGEAETFAGRAVLRKPFTLGKLAAAIAAALAQAR